MHMTKYTQLLGLSAGLAMMASASLADSIAPETFSATLGVGESVTINKTVTVDSEISTSRADVMFLVDTTGSMTSTIAAVRNNLNDILANAGALGDVQFGVAEYRDFVVPGRPWGSSGDFPFRLNQSITSDAAAVTTAIGGLTVSGGNDIPESNLYALQQTAVDPAIGWRAGAARIVVWFGDAPGHDPNTTPGYPGPTLAQTIASLTAADISVIGVNAPSGPGIDTGFGSTPAGQATAITNATGGSLFNLGATGSIVDEIDDAITAVFSSYSSVSLSPVGVPAGVGVEVSAPHLGTFDRSETRFFDFTVTFTGLAPGTHDFTIDALVDRGVVATEKDRITVTGDTSVIPLPATGWLLLGGLGALGALSRRRKAA